MLLTYWNVSERVENIVGKRENEGLDYHFLHFSTIQNWQLLSGAFFLPNNIILTVTRLKTCEDDNPFPNDNILDWSKLKEFADTNFKFDENGRKFSKGWKTMKEKKKLLVTSHFSFSRSVFRRLVLQTRENQGLFGKGLNVLY